MNVTDLLGIMSVLPVILGGIGLSGVGSLLTQLVKVSPLPTNNDTQKYLWLIVIDYILLAVVGYYMKQSIVVMSPFILVVVPMSIGIYEVILKRLRG